jgi:putative phosphoribosyl transferase
MHHEEQMPTPIDTIRSGKRLPQGDLVIPGQAKALVVFAHGSGSSRHSPRNRYVASELQRRGFGTLLLDLLTPVEDQDITSRFDIGLLSARLLDVLDWVQEDGKTAALPKALFGASTGAAAAIRTAAAAKGRVYAVVSRGGRVDLAGETSLAGVGCPVLLIVGEADEQVLEWNRQARVWLPASSELVVIPGATHLFEEPGTLSEVARLAGDWFLSKAPAAARENR